MPNNSLKRFYRTFRQVATGLPHLRPRLARTLLQDAYHEALLAEQDTASLGAVTVPTEALAELFHATDRTGYPTDVISPAGARLLVKLYRDGQLPTRDGRRGEVSAELAAYCDSEAELEARAQAEAAREVAERQAREARLADPAGIPESEFTWSLLNDLFFHHRGPGPGVLEVGGIEVRKEIASSLSNSGKSRDYAVAFSWRGADGTPRTLERAGLYDANRRNDPARHWGLPPRG